LAAQKAIIEAQKYDDDVQFKFNNIIIIASPYSHDIDLATIYNLRMEILRLKR
jgi:hypothetical protein